MAIRYLENDTHQAPRWFQTDVMLLATKGVPGHCPEPGLWLNQRPVVRIQCSLDDSRFGRHLQGSRAEPCAIRVIPLPAESGAPSRQSAVAKVLCSSLPQADL